MLDDRIRRGMEKQLAERARRIAAGELPLGWKVGFGAPQAMQSLGLARPLVGYLMQSAIHESGVSLHFSEFEKPAIEPEIAVYLDADLDGGSDGTAVRAAISALGSALEIADLTFPPSEGAETILAGNIYQRGVILGPVDKKRAGASLAGLGAAVRINGEGIDLPDDLEANTGPILDVVATVAATLAAMGETLRAGELIIVGSIVPPLFPGAGTTVSYALGDLPAISVSLR